MSCVDSLQPLCDALMHAMTTACSHLPARTRLFEHVALPLLRVVFGGGTNDSVGYLTPSSNTTVGFMMAVSNLHAKHLAAVADQIVALFTPQPTGVASPVVFSPVGQALLRQATQASGQVLLCSLQAAAQLSSHHHMYCTSQIAIRVVRPVTDVETLECAKLTCTDGKRGVLVSRLTLACESCPGCEVRLNNTPRPLVVCRNPSTQAMVTVGQHLEHAATEVPLEVDVCVRTQVQALSTFTVGLAGVGGRHLMKVSPFAGYVSVACEHFNGISYRTLGVCG